MINNNHKETIVYSAINFLGMLLPIIIGLSFFLFNEQQDFNWLTFYEDGQFFLYSASLFTASGYIFYTYKVTNFGLNSILFFICIACILFVSLLYTFLISGISANLNFLFWTSHLIILLSGIFFYYSSYLSNSKVDVIKSQKEGIKKIMDEL